MAIFFLTIYHWINFILFYHDVVVDEVNVSSFLSCCSFKELLLFYHINFNFSLLVCYESPSVIASIFYCIFEML